MTATPSVPPISRIVSLTADAAPVELSGTVLVCVQLVVAGLVTMIFRV
ncbi:hypothetical protein PMS74_09490 [Bifidobacterium longum]|nr:hypothetical protein [Bifidobacterium longum]MDB6871802.1 hypothetical protein [Bifidobacterium longum]MDB6879876.1 hypothetical protein [Bifidobacterium longum]